MSSPKVLQFPSNSIPWERAIEALADCVYRGALPIKADGGGHRFDYSHVENDADEQFIAQVQETYSWVWSHIITGTPEFFNSRAWQCARYDALKKNDGRGCECCGANRRDGAVLHVDHIQPRSRHPELAFDICNLQILCAACNYGKGARDNTDWRPEAVQE